VLIHDSLVHASPYARKTVALTLSSVSNCIRKPARPKWIAHTDFAPFQLVPDDALTQDARRCWQATE
jgi:hypothetical protein